MQDKDKHEEEPRKEQIQVMVPHEIVDSLCLLRQPNKTLLDVIERNVPNGSRDGYISHETKRAKGMYAIDTEEKKPDGE